MRVGKNFEKSINVPPPVCHLPKSTEADKRIRKLNAPRAFNFNFCNQQLQSHQRIDNISPTLMYISKHFWSLSFGELRIGGGAYIRRTCCDSTGYQDLTVNSICSFWQWTSIWGVVPPPLRSQKLLNVWPWNFYQISSSVKRHEIKKNFWHNWSGL